MSAQIINILTKGQQRNYFSDGTTNGTTITSTNANYLANRAKEEISVIDNELKSVSFFKKEVEMLSDNTKKLLSKGVTSDFLDGVKPKLDYLGKMHSFMAWMREAIKAKESATKLVSNMNLNSYCEMMDIELGKAPKMPNRGSYIDIENVKGDMSIADMQEYLYLNAMASQVGKYIHKGGEFHNARNSMLNVLKTPNELATMGSLIVLFSYEPSVTTEQVESVNDSLLEMNRDYNARLNSFNTRLEKEVEEFNSKIDRAYKVDYEAYSKQCDEYNRRKEEITIQMEDWVKEELNSIKNTKIVIPNDLMSIYDRLKKTEK